MASRKPLPTHPRIQPIGRVAGLLRLGTIVGYDPDTTKVDVYIGTHQEYGSLREDDGNIVHAQLPISYFNTKGGFAGGYPVNGTPILLGQADGGQWYAVSLLAKDTAALNKRKPKVPALEESDYRIQASDNVAINLSRETGITMGEINNALTLDTKRAASSNTFDNIYQFSESSRVISGNILRDTFPNELFPPSLRETSLDFNDTLKEIGLDPVAKVAWGNTNGTVRNPMRTEHREVIYEYAKSFNVLGDNQEFINYKDNKNVDFINLRSRRESRADTLSLSLVSPNYLIETVKGTVVDIYGNILDLNRSIIPIGKIEKLSVKNIKNNVEETSPLGNVFHNIKTLERRSIAFHFEINAKKDLTSPPDITSQADYARDRSRFYFDVDKEGQFKLNVPASSETGNIPLLTRYENYSTVHPNDKTKDPNDLVFNPDSQDILLENFTGSNGVVNIVDDLNGNASPIDRFSAPGAPVHIKYGTAYHDVFKTLDLFGPGIIINERVPTTRLGRPGEVAPKKNYFNRELKISGQNANGGGRSGSINMDGSLDLNIGANTANRHSLVVDLQGATIMNIGRDNTENNISGALHFDGALLIQSGGKTPDSDSRFTEIEVSNGHLPGEIDIRVVNSKGKPNIIRIDNLGIEIHSESRVAIYSHGDMDIRANGKMTIESENLVMNGRLVRKEKGLGAI